MVQKLRNIFSVLMALTLLAPSIAKLHHHHDHFECHAKSEKHLHAGQEECPVCNFAFSAFSTNKTELRWAKAEHRDRYNKRPYLCTFTDHLRYTFQLRGPPIVSKSS